jgi:ABC-type phosphate transport system permease subunit
MHMIVCEAAPTGLAVVICFASSIGFSIFLVEKRPERSQPACAAGDLATGIRSVTGRLWLGYTVEGPGTFCEQLVFI